MAHPKPADCLAGEYAVASGWLQRARTLLDGLGDVPERAWLELREGALALMPANMNHFAYTTAAETTVVLYGQGPVEFKYVNVGPALPARRVLAFAAELDALSLLLAVLAAVFSVGPVLFDRAGAGGVGALGGFCHGEPPSNILRVDAAQVMSRSAVGFRMHWWRPSWTTPASTAACSPPPKNRY